MSLISPRLSADGKKYTIVAFGKTTLSNIGPDVESCSSQSQRLHLSLGNIHNKTLSLFLHY